MELPKAPNFMSTKPPLAPTLNLIKPQVSLSNTGDQPPSLNFKAAEIKPPTFVLPEVKVSEPPKKEEEEVKKESP